MSEEFDEQLEKIFKNTSILGREYNAKGLKEAFGKDRLKERIALAEEHGFDSEKLGEVRAYKLMNFFGTEKEEDAKDHMNRFDTEEEI